MPKVVYVEHDGTEHVVEGEAGKSIMETALDHGVPGIVGDCGGCSACATCQGYVDDRWLGKLPPPSDLERALLDGTLHVRSNSRLTCQIVLQPALDGIVIHLPKSQY